MPLLCIDIGNTHTHYGVVSNGQTLFQREFPTRLIDHPSEGFGPVLERVVASHPDLEGAAFCSVVPAASSQLQRVFEQRRFARPLFQLTPDKRLGVPLGYPKPQEIGQDRLANAAGAQACCAHLREDGRRCDRCLTRESAVTALARENCACAVRCVQGPAAVGSPRARDERPLHAA